MTTEKNKQTNRMNQTEKTLINKSDEEINQELLEEVTPAKEKK